MLSAPSFTKPQIISHLSTTLDFTPFCTEWIPLSARITVCGSSINGNGVIEIYNINETQLNKQARYTFDSAIKCSTYSASNTTDRYLTTGDYMSNLCIIDINNQKSSTPTVLYHTKVNKNDSIINCIDGIGGLNGGQPIELAAATKYNVAVYDIRQSDAVVNINSDRGAGRDCWSVAFGNSTQSSDRYLACGYDNGDLKLFDLRINKFRYECNIGNGIVSIQFDRNDIAVNKLLVTTLENKFTIFDMRTMNPTSGYTYQSYPAQHSNTTVWTGTHTPQNRDIFSTTGGNGSMNVWKYNYPTQRRITDTDGTQRGVCGTVQQLCPTNKLAEQPIVSFDWNKEKNGLFCMCSLDGVLQTGIVTRLNTV